MCVHCETGEIETETHFLLHCHKYSSIRNIYFNKLTNFIKNFTAISETEQMKILLGEGQTAALAARYVWMCHSLRDCVCVCVCLCVSVCVCHNPRDSRWMCIVSDLTCMCVTLLSTTVILSMYICMFLSKFKTVVSNVLKCYRLILLRC